MLETPAEVVFNKWVSKDTYFMGFRSEPMANTAQPGQFVMIHVTSGIDPLLRRPFSICGIKGDVVLILYRVVGSGTAILSEKRPGDTICVLGPLGRGFKAPEKKVRPIVVAGGMGIAPLLFFLLSLSRKDHLFLTGYARSAEAVPLKQLGIVGLSPDIATEDGSKGFHGRVTELLETLLSDSEEKESAIFACGPLPMLKAVHAMAMAHNLPCQVSLESHMACGLGACQGCAVKMAPDSRNIYAHVCQDGPVFDAEALDWEVMQT